MIKKKEVMEKLKEVIDPELKINIVDLGLIYGVETEKNDVKILLTLTFPGCPLAGTIQKEISEKVGSLEKIGEIDLKITFDPPWDLSKISEEARAELGII